jgi:hypothetical protein
VTPHELLAALAALSDLFIPALFGMGAIALIWLARNDQALRRKRK